MKKDIRFSIRTTLVITALIGLFVSTALCSGGIYPDLAGKSRPNPGPVSFPSTFDIFAPPIDEITPESSAPIVYELTENDNLKLPRNSLDRCGQIFLCPNFHILKYFIYNN